MATNFTNRKASQALDGQTVIVTLNSSDSANLGLVEEGMLATHSNGKTGTVRRVDYEGHQFQVEPIQPNMNFSSVSTYGYLAVGDVVSVNT
jgi:hypothetical protein